MVESPEVKRLRRREGRRVFLAFLLPWIAAEYLSLSNVDPAPPPVQMDCSPGFGRTWSYMPVGPQMARILACAQPALGFPVRNLLRRAQASARQLGDRDWPNWANIAYGICFPFVLDTNLDLRLHLLYLAALNSALQVLIFFFAVLLGSRFVRAP